MQYGILNMPYCLCHQSCAIIFYIMAWGRNPNQTDYYFLEIIIIIRCSTIYLHSCIFIALVVEHYLAQYLILIAAAIKIHVSFFLQLSGSTNSSFYCNTLSSATMISACWTTSHHSQLEARVSQLTEIQTAYWIKTFVSKLQASELNNVGSGLMVISLLIICNGFI